MDNDIWRNSERLRLRQLRDSCDPFSLDEIKFREHFRIPKALALEFIDELLPFMIEEDDDLGSIPYYLRVLIALQFFAKGSYQSAVGAHNICNVSQPTTSRCINQVSKIIDENIAKKYIKFPVDAASKAAKAIQFQEEFDFPNAIGCIDCVHITIVAPSDNDSDRPKRLYRCRKNFYSINVEAICDAQLLFLWVNPRFPGSTHDSAIWRVSPVRENLKNSFNSGEHYFLIGDSGYPLEPFLFTPYPEPQSRAELKYNKLHKKARNSVERAFGVLKAKFRCCLKHRVLHYHPTTAAKIINSCFTLYNYLKIHGIDMDDVEPIFEEITPEETPTLIPENEYYRTAVLNRNNYSFSLL
ncbi:putative nuclease HARBI1 [Lutzomyia longipalpis]|uniref:putative nuclease HARBI1 n=1 Tax=Lutzomyia longipalpis TaxID=7200 RepID=UPI0024846194|nr:putative nuclease HARBI1 [Lutzomyia longipalpis]